MHTANLLKRTQVPYKMSFSKFLSLSKLTYKISILKSWSEFY